VRIAEEIDNSITDNNLAGKISFIVTDNASNMKRALDVLRGLQDTVDTSQTANDHADEVVVDDDTVWENLDGQDDVEVSQAIDKQCSVRLSCFAHSL